MIYFIYIYCIYTRRKGSLLETKRVVFVFKWRFSREWKHMGFHMEIRVLVRFLVCEIWLSLGLCSGLLTRRLTRAFIVKIGVLLYMNYYKYCVLCLIICLCEITSCFVLSILLLWVLLFQQIGMRTLITSVLCDFFENQSGDLWVWVVVKWSQCSITFK